MGRDFFDIFTFSYIDMAIVAIFFILIIIQIYYYVSFYYKPYKVAKGLNMNAEAEISQLKMVSVIISSENEGMRLSKNLPLILDQDYPNFEVIVINNGSTDETADLIESLKLKYTNLYTTYLPFSNDKDFGRRKLAFTLGAKAAKGDILIFTEPHSIPASNQWIYLITKDIDNDIEVVLGCSHFSKYKDFFNRVARYDNHLLNMQFISKAIMKEPYTGIYGNIAFKKSLFFDNKGFASHLALENGEDVFINQIVSPSNTAVCLDPRAFTEAKIDNYSLWKRIKKNYSVAKLQFKGKAIHFFGGEILSRIFFYLLFFSGLVYSILSTNYGLLILLIVGFAIRFSAQVVVINKGTEYFKTGKFHFSLPVVDLVQPFFNLIFRTRSKRAIKKIK